MLPIVLIFSCLLGYESYFFGCYITYVLFLPALGALAVVVVVVGHFYTCDVCCRAA